MMSGKPVIVTLFFVAAIAMAPLGLARQRSPHHMHRTWAPRQWGGFDELGAFLWMRGMSLYVFANDSRA